MFTFPVRIYYEDTDVGGVVYYANYLRYLERARSEWLRAAGFDLSAVKNQHGGMFVVRRVECDYLSPALLGDLLTVSCEPRKTGQSKLIIAQRIFRSTELLHSAVVTLAFISSTLLKPIAMPPDLWAAVQPTPT